MIGLIYLLIIRLIGGVIAYLTILLILAGLVGLGYLFQSRIDYYKEKGDKNYETVMYVFCVFFYALGFIWLMTILFMCNNIRMAIALTEVGSQYVWSVCSILLVPFVLFIIIAGYIAYWIALAVFIYSSGDIVKHPSTFVAQVKW